jgi:hypothetical protein
MSTRLVLLTPLKGEDLSRLTKIFDGVEICVARTLSDLETAAEKPSVLLSFGSGVVVPESILGRFAHAYNLHAAPPEFPGRDPHHHAIYRNALTYGATLHVMTKAVDAGPILAVERFDVPANATPQALLRMANDAGFALLQRYSKKLASGTVSPDPTEGWSGVATRRADLFRLAELSPLVEETELARRTRALANDDYDNLHMTLHGQRFRLRPAGPVAADEAYAEFTETGFTALLDALIAGGYRFASYGDSEADRHVIWRHDVDFSMHRGAKLAAIEAARGVRATYFVNPRSTFYNLLEADVAAKARAIAGLGHEIGLHFDAPAPDGGTWTATTLEAALTKEKMLIEAIVERPVRVVSWHNPDQSNLLSFEGDMIAGLHNAYSARLKRDYVYCSDSNGYWRFTPMAEVIAAGHPRLHLITHPAWWTPTPMSPSARVDRAILGRARAVRRDYDGQLQAAGRKNIDG